MTVAIVVLVLLLQRNHCEGRRCDDDEPMPYQPAPMPREMFQEEPCCPCRRNFR